MVRADFAVSQSTQHEALVSALVEACAWCDEPENRASLVTLLARPEYLNTPVEVIAPALTGPLDCGAGRVVEAPDFLLFHRDGANAPKASLGAAMLRRFAAGGLLDASVANDADLPRKLFREDIFTRAISNTTTHEIQPV